MLCPSSQLWPIDDNKVCSEDEPTSSKDIRQTETESKYTYRSDVIYIYSCIEMYRIIDNIWTVVHEMFYIWTVVHEMFYIWTVVHEMFYIWTVVHEMFYIWTVVHEMFLYIKRNCISMFRICNSNNLISHLW